MSRFLVFRVLGFFGFFDFFDPKGSKKSKKPKKFENPKNRVFFVPGGFLGPDRPGRYEVDFSSARWGPPQKPPSFIQKTGPRTCGIVAGLVIVKEY